MNERIKKIRKDAGLNQTEFGAAIGATLAMITSYERGKVIPDAAKRMLICERFNVNPEWLEHGGDVPPYQQGLIPRLQVALRNAPAIEAALTRLVDRMSADDWHILNTVIEKALETKKDEER